MPPRGATLIEDQPSAPRGATLVSSSPRGATPIDDVSRETKPKPPRVSRKSAAMASLRSSNRLAGRKPAAPLEDFLTGAAAPFQAIEHGARGVVDSFIPMDYPDPTFEMKRGIEGARIKENLPQPGETVLGDTSGEPWKDALAQTAETVLGTEDLAQTATDINYPILNTLGNVGSALFQGVGMSRTPSLARLGAEGLGGRMASGAILAEQAALRGTGVQDPGALATAPLAGAMGGVIPTTGVGTAIGNIAADVASSFAELARLNPDLADKIINAPDTLTSEDRMQAVSMLGAGGLSSALGNVMGLSGHLSQTRQNRQRDAQAQQRAALVGQAQQRALASADDVATAQRLLDEQQIRGVEEASQLSSEIARYREDVAEHEAFLASLRGSEPTEPKWNEPVPPPDEYVEPGNLQLRVPTDMGMPSAKERAERMRAGGRFQQSEPEAIEPTWVPSPLRPDEQGGATSTGDVALREAERIRLTEEQIAREIEAAKADIYARRPPTGPDVSDAEAEAFSNFQQQQRLADIQSQFERSTTYEPQNLYRTEQPQLREGVGPLRSQGLTGEAQGYPRGQGEIRGEVPGPRTRSEEREVIPPSIPEVRKRFEKATGMRFRNLIQPKGALGRYDPTTGSASTKEHSDLQTLTHEYAHALDDEFRTVKPWVDVPTSPYDAELNQFFKIGTVPLGPPLSKKKLAAMTPQELARLDQQNISTSRREAQAEFVRNWVLDPVGTEARAPQFTRYFFDAIAGPRKKSKLRAKNEVLPLDALVQLSGDLRRMRESGAMKGALNVELPVQKKTFVQDMKAKLGFDEEAAKQKKDEYAAFLELHPSLKDKAEYQITDTAGLALKRYDAVMEERGMNRGPKEKGKLSPELDFKRRFELYRGAKEKSNSYTEMVGPHVNGVPLLPEVRAFGGLTKFLSRNMRKGTRAEKARDFRMAQAFLVDRRALSVMEQNKQRGQEMYDKVMARYQKQASRIDTSTSNGQRKASAIVAKGTREADKLRALAVKKNENLTGTGRAEETDEVAHRTSMRDFEALPKSEQDRIRMMADDYRRVAEASLDAFHQSGMISTKRYLALKAHGADYAALRRVIDDIEASPFASPLKGSTREIRDPFAAIVDQAFRGQRAVERNTVYRSFNEVFAPQGRGMSSNKTGFLPDRGDVTEVTRNDPGAVRVMYDGREKFYRYAKYYRDLIDSSTPKQMEGFLGFMEKSKNFTQHFTTRSLGFIKNVLIRDLQQLVFNTQSGESGLKVLGRAFTPKSRALKDTYHRLGVGETFGGNVLETQDTKRLVERAMLGDERSLPVRSWRHLMRAMDGALGFVESRARLAEMEATIAQAKKKGYTQSEAEVIGAHNALSLMNFRRSGATIKQLNRFIPFLNPSVQGLSVDYQALLRNPVKFATKFAAFVVLPSVISAVMADENGYYEEYKNLPHWRRAFFYNFKVQGSDKFFVIPKPFSVGAAAAFFERLYEKEKLGNERAFEGVGNVATQAFMPLGTTELLSPAGLPGAALGLAMNKDLFLDRYVVPPDEDGLGIAARKGRYSASRIGQLLEGAAVKSQEAMGREPLWGDARQFDYAIGKVFSSYGRQVLSASDIGRADKPDAGSKLVDQIFGFTTASPNSDAVNVQALMRDAKAKGYEDELAPLYKFDKAIRATKDKEKRKELIAAKIAWAEKKRNELDLLPYNPVKVVGAKRRASQMEYEEEDDE